MEGRSTPNLGGFANSAFRGDTQVPKWLEEITSTLSKEYYDESSRRSSLSSPDQSLFGLAFSGSNIPNRIPYFEGKIGESRSATSSAKHGRRSSVGWDLLHKSSPNHLTITPAYYVVPKISEPVDLASIIKPDLELEKCWKSLNDFNLSHKGRLTSTDKTSKQSKTKSKDSGLVASGDAVSGKK